jgi:hypothetical protein
MSEDTSGAMGEGPLDGAVRFEPRLYVAVPTLVRKLPEPIRKVIGDLSDTERVLVGLQPRSEPGPPP